MPGEEKNSNFHKISGLRPFVTSVLKFERAGDTDYLSGAAIF